MLPVIGTVQNRKIQRDRMQTGGHQELVGEGDWEEIVEWILGFLWG